METYHRETYARVHPRGRKRDFAYRLEGVARAGRAGVRRLSLGALLGLYHWWADGFRLGLHARYLQKECWQSAMSLSFPRLRQCLNATRYSICPLTEVGAIDAGPAIFCRKWASTFHPGKLRAREP
jgi:2-iminoacetate synthase ThiH